VVRTTVQALAAILGGTQSLHVNSKDEALALPSEEAVQLSLRTQQILGYESGVSEVVDPLGGSYYMESLTNRLEEQAWEYLDRIDRMGGALAALEQGYQMKEIQEAAYRHQIAVESEQRVIVGVNRFRSPTPPLEGLLRVDRREAQQQVDRLNAMRRERDNSLVKKRLDELEAVARSEENTMPATLDCVEAYCTTGEICDVFRKVFGTYRGLASF